ncbi:NAD(P)H-binding protein [Caldimonas thermodepolymerans]|uniref:NAD(P)H-binding protein n=1 Tax=Caldimonas thermodepolymerans TaxID=215580 RepID=UPI00248FCE93|nr:NAD(P)H-binding protein [Caldimonas thermodepolymerans]
MLAVGATGSIGRLVVAEAIRQGYQVRALVRDAAKARRVLPPQAESRCPIGGCGTLTAGGHADATAQSVPGLRACPVRMACR